MRNSQPYHHGACRRRGGGQPAAISWVSWMYTDTPPVSAAFQVAFGGALAFAMGILIGGS
jgi:hypothetical protein